MPSGCTGLKFLDEQSEINILKVHITNNWSGK